MANIVSVGKRRQLGFFQVDNSLLLKYGKLIGPNGIAVYSALALHAGQKDAQGKRRCWPSYITIAEETGMCRNSVITAIKKLEAAGLIEVQHGQSVAPGQANQSNTYTLLPLTDTRTSATDAPGASAANAPGSATDGRGVVQQMHQASAANAPELDSINQTHKNKTKERGRAKPEDSYAAPAAKKSLVGEILDESLKQFGIIPSGLNRKWLENRLAQYGEKAVRTAITIAEERGKPAASFISTVLERLTVEELAQFDERGERLARKTTPETVPNLPATVPEGYPFADFSPGFHDNPKAIERRIQNLREVGALDPEREGELMVRLEWAKAQRDISPIRSIGQMQNPTGHNQERQVAV